MSLEGKTIAVLVEQDYQDLEVWFPILRFREEGAKVLSVGTGSAPSYRGKNGYPIQVDKDVSRVSAKDLDAIVVPGGWAPDFLRRSEAVLTLVREMDQEKKVIGAICHAGWVLASADILRGRTATCFSAIKDDVTNAGARFVDQEVVRDGNLITSRNPFDLPAFCRTMIAAIRESGGN